MGPHAFEHDSSLPISGNSACDSSMPVQLSQSRNSSSYADWSKQESTRSTAARTCGPAKLERASRTLPFKARSL